MSINSISTAIGSTLVTWQNVAELANSAGQRANQSPQVSDYLTLSENTSWLALSDQVANGIELAALVQVRNESLDQLGLLVVEMRELALRNLNGEDVTDQLAEKELEISTLIGSNIIGLPKETVFMSSEANPSNLLTIDEIDYFGELSVADLLTGVEFRVASLEVDITQVAIAHFQASQAHDPDTCPIWGGHSRWMIMKLPRRQRQPDRRQSATRLHLPRERIILMP